MNTLLNNNQDFSLQSAILMKLIGAILEKKGITHQQIADLTGFERSSVTRMLSGKFSPSLANFLKIIDAVGLMIYLQDKDGKVSAEEMKDFLEQIAEELNFNTHKL